MRGASSFCGLCCRLKLTLHPHEVGGLHRTMNRLLNTFIAMFALPSVVLGQAVCNSFAPGADRCDLTASAATQAKCLLRPVKKFGNLGEPLTALPPTLDSIIGEPTSASLTIDQLKRFLTLKGISEADVGGSLSVALSAPKYFVIHDTSDFLELTDFPANINDATSSLNRLTGRVTRPICHVYINRVGQSATAVVFESASPPSGTKFGLCNSARKKEFLHIENIQPRIRDRSVRFENDAIAPTPGFSDAQLERLALIYIAASARSGRWLIPAYHSPIDLGFRDRHDDPQNFDLEKWAASIKSLIQQISAS